MITAQDPRRDPCELCGAPAEFRSRMLGWACRSCFEKSPRGPEFGGAYAVPLAAIEREEVEWLYPGRVPLGMLTLLIGDPGVGKSLLSLYLASLVSQNGAGVLLLSAEDHPGATIRPRAEATGADLSRLHIVSTRRDGVEDGLALPDDADELSDLALDLRARLVVIDPLAAHLPESVNSWRDQSVRRALAPLHRLAESRRCAVLVVAHLNKARGADPLYRAGGSIGIPAAVRSALLLARDPDDPDGERGSQRVLAHVKCNVGERAESLACEVEPVEIADDVVAARLLITGTSATSAADLLDAPSAEESTERDEAAEFLHSQLAAGSASVSAIRSAATAHGISWRTIERAKKALGVEAQRVSAGNAGRGRWEWSLPASGKAANSKAATPISQPWRSCENGSSKPSSHASDSQDRHGLDMAVLEGDAALATPEQEAEFERIAAKFGEGPT